MLDSFEEKFNIFDGIMTVIEREGRIWRYQNILVSDVELEEEEELKDDEEE